MFTPPAPGAEVNPAVSVPVLDLFTSKRVIHAYAGAPAAARRAAERSSLRFTWEYRSPRYHAPDAGAAGPDGAAVVVITDDLARPLPPEVERRIAGHRLAAVFAGEEDAFQHHTLVKVYRREKGS